MVPFVQIRHHFILSIYHRSNLVGTKFTCFDGGRSPKKGGVLTDGSNLREELCAIIYVSRFPCFLSLDVFWSLQLRLSDTVKIGINEGLQLQRKLCHMNSNIRNCSFFFRTNGRSLPRFGNSNCFLLSENTLLANTRCKTVVFHGKPFFSGYECFRI